MYENKNILQGKMGKTEKNGKKITQLKWPNAKNQNTKIWDEHIKIVYTICLKNLDCMMD